MWGLTEIISIPSVFLTDFIQSVVMILALIMCRLLILRLLVTNNDKLSLDVKLRWSVNLRNILIICIMFGVFIIWAKELQSFALSMVAFVVALVLATKELIMCIVGSFLRTMSHSYSLGDHIEVGPYRGRVIDINLFTTMIMEMGPAHLAHQMTGRAMIMPNSLLLSAPVIRENHTGAYIVHTFVVPAPYSTDPILGESILLAAAQELCHPYLKEVRAHMRSLEAEKLFDTPAVEPRVAIMPADDRGYKFVVRVAIPVKERHRIEQAILHRFMYGCYGHTDVPTGLKAHIASLESH